MTTAEQVKGLRDAAGLITGCAQLGVALHEGDDGPQLGALRPRLAHPLAAILLSAAFQIEQAGSADGLPVRNALTIAGRALGYELGGLG